LYEAVFVLMVPDSYFSLTLLHCIFACSSCEPESLAGQSYKGKILLCASGSDGTGPLLADAAGAVIVTAQPDIAFLLPLPAVKITGDQFTEIMAYVNKTRCNRLSSIPAGNKNKILWHLVC
jgi:hypothetical protein